MKPPPYFRDFFGFWVASAFLLAGCSNGGPTTLEKPDLGVAQTSAKSDPTVDKAYPDNAPQDTTLDVAVLGSGFDRGSKAEWALDGVVSPKVKTNSTKFVNSKKLVANITIAADADTVLYDIIVTTSDGRKGIGIEVFKVRPKGPDEGTPLAVTFRDGAGDMIRSDARFADPTYVHNECGVRANFPPSGGGDFTFDADEAAITGKEGKVCGGRDPRFIVLDLSNPAAGDPGPILEEGGFTVSAGLEGVTSTEPVLWTAQFQTSHCRLWFNPNKVAASSNVLATRVDANTWRLETQPGPDDVAYCGDGERSYHLPFAVTVRLK